MQGDLYAERPMSRRDDPATSKASAEVVLPSLGKIQALVLEVYRAHGPMSARVAERLREFDAYGFSTIRKRISELAAEGLLEVSGTDTDGRAPCAIYRVVER